MEHEMSFLQNIQPIACLLNPDATCDPVTLEKASITIDRIAVEICQRIECRRQVLGFNPPDRIPPEHTKTALLTACGTLDTTCTARRLRKLKPSMCCPIMLQFQDENDALRLLTSYALLCSTEKFRIIKVTAVRTRMQRQLTKKLPPSTPPSDALLNTSPTHMINKAINPPIVRTTGASMNGAHRCPSTNHRPPCTTANSTPYAVVPKPVTPPAASTRVDAPVVPLNSHYHMITPSTEPTPSYSAPSSFIALQEPEPSTAPTNGLSALPLMKIQNVSISSVDLSPGPKTTNAERLQAGEMTTPIVDSTRSRRRPPDLLSLRVPPTPKYALEIYLLSMPRYVTHPQLHPRKSDPSYAVVPEPFGPSTTITCVDPLIVPLYSQCSAISPSTGTTPNHPVASSFIALPDPEPSTAPANGLSALPSVKTANVPISPLELSPGPGANDVARLPAKTVTASDADGTCARNRPPDLLSLRVAPLPKYTFGLKHLLSRSQYVTRPREFVPRSSQDKWTLPRPLHNHMTSTYRKLGETSHPQIPKPSTVMPLPVRTPRIPTLRPSSTNMTCGLPPRASLVLGGAYNLQTPLPNLSPYQAMLPWPPACYLPGIPIRQLPTPLPTPPSPKPRRDPPLQPLKGTSSFTHHVPGRNSYPQRPMTNSVPHPFSLPNLPTFVPPEHHFRQPPIPPQPPPLFTSHPPPHLTMQKATRSAALYSTACHSPRVIPYPILNLIQHLLPWVQTYLTNYPPIHHQY
ncbi:hypothetical protein CLF_108355 [Clonorchis sinensis]|uniref:Uncharacterized protein n=1 Tax=Clonorchis sinensis TaxID=79923 RepID=G7YRJ7_CLOSI|nr:hypothetical protein CLF_108355 [Clonorchis sinensis]